MSRTIIKVQNIGKQYRLGEVGTGTLSHDLNRFWHKIRGKEDPYLKLGVVNDRTEKGSSDLVWALRDVSFEVQEGEVLGVIGKNGAGKSTLLKILSQITAPTVGEIRIRGRVASLLEVGTGFHPELTGRENIYLNGAILGMTKSEIKSQFDGIVDFSGVSKYIDTPVKRYSSGMLVRLGFAVAAHLEPEILIVDEVLAVGDAEFQSKCIGKMKDVSRNGRTVLFVSHNLGSISELCNKGILLENGTLKMSGDIEGIISKYKGESGGKHYEAKQVSTAEIYIQRIDVIAEPDDNHNELGMEIGLAVNNKEISGVHLGVLITDAWGQKVTTVVEPVSLKNISGSVKLTMKTELEQFRNGKYFIDAAVFIPNAVNYEYLKEVVSFEVNKSAKGVIGTYDNRNIGPIILKSSWDLEKL